VKAALRRAWEARAPRERMVIAALAAILGAASYLWVLHSADRGRAQLSASVAALRTQAVLLDRQAAEYERLRATPAAAASPTDLRTLVQARTDAARLSGALTRIDAPDADHVRVTFGALPFVDWLGLIAALESQHVRLEAARIEALAAPGLVSITATFTRSGPQ
jgi:type II secretory pathway component PulM